jgi:hypothetical protein
MQNVSPGEKHTWGKTQRTRRSPLGPRSATMPDVYDSLEVVEGVGPGDAAYTQPLELGPPGVSHGKLDNGLT